MYESVVFFLNDPATTEISPLSLHDALPISCVRSLADPAYVGGDSEPPCQLLQLAEPWPATDRSEEHTSELQSQSNLVCRLLLEKKKKTLSTPPLILPFSVSYLHLHTSQTHA